MGNQDIRLRYKRSVIGPFWISITLAAWIAGISILYSQILNAPFLDYLVYLSCGLLAWNFISAIVAEGSVSLIDNSGHIKSAPISLSVFAARVVYRNSIVFLHNSVVVGIVLIYAGVGFSTTTLLALPGMAAIGLVLFFAIGISGVLCARFRDLQQVISNLMQVSFFLTPIIWQPGMNGRSMVVSQINPFYHLIELVRSPLMGALPARSSVLFVTIMIVLMAAGAVIAWSSARRRVFYWV